MTDNLTEELPDEKPGALEGTIQVTVTALTRENWVQFCRLSLDSKAVSGFFPSFARRLLKEARRYAGWGTEQLYILNEHEMAVIEDVRARAYVAANPTPLYAEESA